MLSKGSTFALLVVISLIWSAALAADEVPSRITGVNLATGGFSPDRLPGQYGKDYIYPDAETAAPFLEAGMNTVRLPILWERIQPELFQPLSSTEMARIDKMIGEMAGFKTIIIDVHNYARYRGDLLGTPNVPGAALANLWGQLAQRYRYDERIVFGLMNEPYGIDSLQWRSITDKTVSQIRGAGATNLVLISGTRWSGGHSWFAGGAESNAAAFADFVDPGSNYLYEIHQYLDDDSSGTSERCVNTTIGRERLARVTGWLRTQGARAVLGEFGASANSKCLRALDDLMRFLEQNADVWAGWTYWAGGGWWGDYHFNIQPSEGKMRPQMEILDRYLDVETDSSG